MITPKEYFKLTSNPYNLKFMTKKGLGNGGFIFKNNTYYEYINGREVAISIRGKYVTM